VPAFHSLADELAGRAGILAVYITEAHATDEWPISSSRYSPGGRVVALAQPRTDAARCAAARGFQEEFQVRGGHRL